MNTKRDWAAVVGRDRTADGRFVYAVASTGIYCRPSCPSRRPARRHVTFFRTSALAETAGYRACRRCRPSAAVMPGTASLLRAARAVQAAPDAVWSASRMAGIAGLSVSALQRRFRAELKITPRQFVSAVRRGTLKAGLRRGDGVAAAVFDAGFGSSSRIYGGNSTLGMTPATYARGGRGARIDWMAAPSAVGTVLVAATHRGVCFIEIGDLTPSLLAELSREFPSAEIAEQPSKALEPHVRAAVALANAEPARADIPLDVRGTAFQWRVWRALQAIPAGETRSYGAIARAIGAPASVRAVARACATNPVSLAIPCHRVVGVDGALTGYRWGVQVKRALLEGERRAVGRPPRR